MEQQDHVKVNVTDALSELNSLSRNSTMPSSSPSTSSSTTSLSSSLTADHNLRILPLVPQSQTSQPINSLTDSFNNPNHIRTNTKIQINLIPRYISKITSNTKKHFDASHRMRPYYIPERSRTKSENNVERDVLKGIYAEAADDFLNSINSNSSSTSMMETCDGYVIADPGSSSSSSNVVTNTGTTPYGFNNLFSGYAFPANHHLYHYSANAVAGQQATNHPIARAKLLTLNQLKKSKSLEDIRAENLDGSQPSHEMEFVSSRIQKLKVQE